ncbi:MAG TPA: hypothetical protein VFK41_10470 [Nocardioidaceae bacterium]|nr:hypothetical protein [Nocardioidaceae bacterium]
MKKRIHALQLAQAKRVAGMTDEQLAWVEQGVARRGILRTIGLALPLKFKKSVGGDIDGVLELQFVDPLGGAPDRIQLVMRRGRCRARRNGTARPDATALMHLSDLVRLGVGAVEAGWLANDGRVVLSGDPFLFVRFPAAFGLRTRPLYAEHRGPTLQP